MAKEQLHNWGRTVITIITLIFVCGVSYQRMSEQGDDISTNITDIKEVKDDVHRIELDAKDIKAVAVQGVEALTSINNRLTNIEGTMIKQATIQAVNSVKLETLTKD